VEQPARPPARDRQPRRAAALALRPAGARPGRLTTRAICVTCGTQFADSEAPPPGCPICEDQRQYVPESGQRWTTLDELRADHRNRIEPEGELVGIGTDPSFAIGQRALLVPFGEGQLLWDCVTLLDEPTAEEVERRGGLAAIAISHPHYYSAMVEWAHRFGCPVYLHAADAEWIMRPDPAIELWEGERRELGHGLTLLRCGGHFPGGTVLHWAAGAAERGVLLSGDIVQVIPDRRHVGFMYSYPNLIPLPAREVEAIRDVLRPLAFETIYGAWWGRVVHEDGKGAVERSADRYVRAVSPRGD
jgi:glyoxylase-like metal-dependent hydrolase (beta-lactamase superfamily II)